MGEGIAVDSHNTQLDETRLSGSMRDFISKDASYSLLARPQILSRILFLQQARFYNFLVLHTCKLVH